MKIPFVATAVLCLTAFGLHAQVKIGNNPQNLDNASVLELESTSRALVITRVTTAQMNVIFPLKGALIYNTDEDCVFHYDGNQWQNLCNEENTTNVSLELVDSELILTDSDGNTVTVSLAGSINQSFSANAIENFNETITITQTGDNHNFEVKEITGDQIVDGTVNGVDIQNGSVTQIKLAPNSVGVLQMQDNAITDNEIDYNEVTLLDFDNDAGYITNANIVSPDTNNALSNSNGAFYDDTPLNDAITTNENAINTNTGNISTNTANIGANSAAITTNSTAISNLQADVNQNEADANAAIAAVQADVDQNEADADAAITANENAINTNTGNININTAAITTNSTDLATHIADDNDTDDTNEIQDLDLDNTTNILSLSGDATTVDLTSYLDNQTASEVGVALTATNYTALTADVESHLTGIDNELGNLESNNFAETDLELNGNRVHNLNGNDLVLQGLLGSGGNVGIGSGTNPPSAQLHVGGDVKASEFVSQIPGNAAAPDYTFEGDLDTGMFSTTAGNIGFSTDGTEALNIDATQNVTVRSNLTLEGTLTDNASSLGTDGQVLTKNSTGQVIWATPAEATVTATPGSIFFSDAAGTGLAENNSELFWDVTGSSGSGALGIGLTNPQSKLDVDGQVQARNGFAANNGGNIQPSYSFYNDTDTGIFRGTLVNYLRFSTAGVEAITINPSQNIGIGSTNPTSKLDIAGSVAKPITVENTNITLDETNYTVILDAAITVNLPAAGTCEGRIYRIIARGNSYDLNFNIEDSDGGSIDETSGTTRNLVLQSDGTNWYQIN
ncbi:beta strand repeat-containing protein [Croceivirga radicis]|uniref:beta strand repeat-containing protein n=1 Tax=Croceivirga radicis TaxID=1929488 RepID=UPI000255B883|nr:hypothetical protein [Croceivirga radicis]